MTTDKRVFVVHAWKNVDRSGEAETFKIPRGGSYPDTLKNFMHEHTEFVSSDIGMQAPGEEKPAFLGNHHDGKLTAYVC